MDERTKHLHSFSELGDMSIVKMYRDCCEFNHGSNQYIFPCPCNETISKHDHRSIQRGSGHDMSSWLNLS
jgi:alpha-D-ribose 1-methylphosphonate 5-phosphate C-P lyase